jgi:hypothetical protein
MIYDVATVILGIILSVPLVGLQLESESQLSKYVSRSLVIERGRNTWYVLKAEQPLGHCTCPC